MYSPDALRDAFWYQSWCLRTMAGGEELARQRRASREMRHRPLISVLTPVHDVPIEHLRSAIESVRRQSYDNWELCLVDDGSSDLALWAEIARYGALDHRITGRREETALGIAEASNAALRMAHGEFVALLDHDDVLDPRALYHVAELLNTSPDADLIYTDEDVIGEHAPRDRPSFKPDWSPELLLSMMYTSHLSAYRRQLVVDLGGFRPGYDGSQDYDLALRVTEQTGRVFHIPRVLYHWRAAGVSVAASPENKPYAFSAARRALTDALARRGIAGQCDDGPLPGLYHVRFEIAATPRLTVFVWAPVERFGSDEARRAAIQATVRSIEESGGYPPCEVVALPDASAERSEPSTADGAPLGGQAAPGLLAERVSQVTGDILLFVDAGLTGASTGWVRALVEHAQHEEVGAVGAKILTPDDSVEHGGLVVVNGRVGQLYRAYGADHHGYLGRLRVASNYSAVSGSCVMTRRDLFDRLRGLRPDLGVELGWVDYCLRLRETGHRVVFMPGAGLLRSFGRDRLHYPAAHLVAFEQTWREQTATDPFYAPALTGSEMRHATWWVGDASA